MLRDPKRVAIEKLSSNLIKYTEQEQLLSIINALQIEKKPVFFAEGSIDPIIIKEAWHRLYSHSILARIESDRMPRMPPPSIAKSFRGASACRRSANSLAVLLRG
jgi:hypothetical protein